MTVFENYRDKQEAAILKAKLYLESGDKKLSAFWKNVASGFEIKLEKLTLKECSRCYNLDGKKKIHFF